MYEEFYKNEVKFLRGVEGSLFLVKFNCGKLGDDEEDVIVISSFVFYESVLSLGERVIILLFQFRLEIVNMKIVWLGGVFLVIMLGDDGVIIVVESIVYVNFDFENVNKSLGEFVI